MKIVILGASGMLGNTALRLFAGSAGYDAIGTIRAAADRNLFPADMRPTLRPGIDVDDTAMLANLLGEERPAVVVNCVGIVKQLADAADPLTAIPINSLLPHRLAVLCAEIGARLIHVSTDCVFAGTVGNYAESDLPDARDLYGRSKLLGEVDYPHAVTLRTSIIGHELRTPHGLVGWFLAQTGPVKGYTRAVFSGLPAVALATVMRDFVIPNQRLRGLYHVAARPIDKGSLLELVAAAYGSKTKIIPDDRVVVDRSLNARRFRDATGYEPADWPELVAKMRDFR